MPPSSMTKLMTLYIVYERLASGRMKLDDQLPVSEKAWRMGGSKMFVQIGTTVAVEDLIRGIVVDSGNDACIVLAEAISGSEEQFADLMNDTAKKLGLTNSHFMNATGWPADNHYMSCHDIATLAADIIRQFPQYYHYDSEKTFKYNNIEQGNRNPLVQKGIGGRVEDRAYRGGRLWRRRQHQAWRPADRAGAERHGYDARAVRGIGAADGLGVREFRGRDAVHRRRRGGPGAGVAGRQPDVPLVGGHDLVVTMPRNWRRNAKVQISYDAPIRAPVAKGATIGKLTVAGDGVPSMDVPLLAGADVPKLSLPGRAMAVLSHYVTGS